MDAEGILSLTNDKTLFISDLDGTLLNRSAELSAYTAAALNAMIGGGLHFSVATARSPVSTLNVLDGMIFNVPLVLMNGVLIYDAGRNHYDLVNYMRPDVVSAVVKVLKEHNATGLLCKMADSELTTYHEALESKILRDFVHERVTKFKRVYIKTDSFTDVPPDNVINIAILDSLELLTPVQGALADRPDLNMTLYKDVYSPEMWCLEIFSDGASKRNAVAFLRETRGYEKIIGFGDNLNDLPMFEACDVRVAVENARPELKAAADYICGSNDDDGVVKWIEEHIK